MSKKAESHDKQFPGQHDGETVQLIFRQHPLVMRKALILGLLGITASVLPLDFFGIWYSSDSLYRFFIKFALGVTVFVFVIWFFRWVSWFYTMYLVTDQRILAIKQKGLFDRQVEEWQLQDITNLNYHIGGFQAVLFGFGDITARSYLGDLEMKIIHNPAEIHAQLMQVVRRAGGASGSTQSSN